MALPFLTSVLDEGEWSNSCPFCITLRETAYTCYIGCWLGPRVGVDGEEKKLLLPTEMELMLFGRPTHSLVAIPARVKLIF
jgi:hypothetical protein